MCRFIASSMRGFFENWGRKNQEPEVLKKWINHTPHWKFLLSINCGKHPLLMINFRFQPILSWKQTVASISNQPRVNLCLQEAGNGPRLFLTNWPFLNCVSKFFCYHNFKGLKIKVGGYVLHPWMNSINLLI